MQSDLDARLRELLVFTAPPTLMGLPRTLFVQILILSAGLGITLSWWFGLLLFFITFAPLYRAHSSDPRAFEVWVTALRERIARVSPFYPSYLRVELD